MFTLVRDTCLVVLRIPDDCRLNLRHLKIPLHLISHRIHLPYHQVTHPNLLNILCQLVPHPLQLPTLTTHLPVIILHENVFLFIVDEAGVGRTDDGCDWLGGSGEWFWGGFEGGFGVAGGEGADEVVDLLGGCFWGDGFEEVHPQFLLFICAEWLSDNQKIRHRLHPCKLSKFGLSFSNHPRRDKMQLSRKFLSNTPKRSNQLRFPILIKQYRRRIPPLKNRVYILGGEFKN